MKITRRNLAAAVLAPVAVSALPQTTAQTQPPPASPDDELKAARDRAKLVADALAKQVVPMSTEPAFQFKA